MRVEWLQPPAAPQRLAAGHFTSGTRGSIAVSTYCTLELYEVSDTASGVTLQVGSRAELDAPVLWLVPLPEPTARDQLLVVTADLRYHVFVFPADGGPAPPRAVHTGEFPDQGTPKASPPDVRNTLVVAPSALRLPPDHRYAHCAAFVLFQSHVHLLWLPRAARGGACAAADADGCARVTREWIKMDTHALTTERNQVIAIQILPGLCPMSGTPLVAVLYNNYCMHYDLPLVHVSLIAPSLAPPSRFGAVGAQEGPWAVHNLHPTTAHLQRVTTGLLAPPRTGTPPGTSPSVPLDPAAPDPQRGTAEGDHDGFPVLAFSDAEVLCFSSKGLAARLPVKARVVTHLELSAPSPSTAVQYVLMDSAGMLHLLTLQRGATHVIGTTKKAAEYLSLASTIVTPQLSGAARAILPPVGAEDIGLLDAVSGNAMEARVRLVLRYADGQLSVVQVELLASRFSLLASVRLPTVHRISSLCLCPVSGAGPALETRAPLGEVVAYGVDTVARTLARYVSGVSLHRVSGDCAVALDSALFSAAGRLVLSDGRGTSAWCLQPDGPSKGPSAVAGLVRTQSSVHVGAVCSGKKGEELVMQVVPEAVLLLHATQGLQCRHAIDAPAGATHACATADGLVAVAWDDTVQLLQCSVSPAKIVPGACLRVKHPVACCALHGVAPGRGTALSTPLLALGVWIEPGVTLYAPGLPGGDSLAAVAHVTTPAGAHSLLLATLGAESAAPWLFAGLLDGTVAATRLWVTVADGGAVRATLLGSIVVARAGHRPVSVRLVEAGSEARPVVYCNSSQDLVCYPRDTPVKPSAPQDSASHSLQWHRVLPPSADCALWSVVCCPSPLQGPSIAYVFRGPDADAACLAIGRLELRPRVAQQQVPLPDAAATPMFLAWDAVTRAVVVLMTKTHCQASPPNSPPPKAVPHSRTTAGLAFHSTAASSHVVVYPSAPTAAPPITSGLLDTLFTGLDVAADPFGAGSLLCVCQCHPHRPVGFVGLWRLVPVPSGYATRGSAEALLLSPLTTLSLGALAPTCCCLIPDWALLCVGAETQLFCWRIEDTARDDAVTTGCLRSPGPAPDCPVAGSPVRTRPVPDAGVPVLEHPASCYHRLLMLQPPGAADPDTCVLLCAMLYQSVVAARLIRSETRSEGLKLSAAWVSGNPAGLTFTDHVSVPVAAGTGMVLLAADAHNVLHRIYLTPPAGAAAEPPRLEASRTPDPAAIWHHGDSHQGSEGGQVSSRAPAEWGVAVTGEARVPTGVVVSSVASGLLGIEDGEAQGLVWTATTTAGGLFSIEQEVVPSGPLEAVPSRSMRKRRTA